MEMAQLQIVKQALYFSNNGKFQAEPAKRSSEIRTVDLILMCPLFRGPTVLQGTADLITMCLYSEVPLYYKGQ